MGLPIWSAATATVSLPAIMDAFANPVLVAAALRRVREKIVGGWANTVLIDISKLERITPETAMLLVAEIERCVRYSRGCNVRSNYPNSPQPAQLLKIIGYFEYLGISPPTVGRQPANIFRICSAYSNDPITANKLIEMFERSTAFDPDLRSKLYGSLIECMGNVFHHAYVGNGHSESRRLDGKWWLLGYAIPSRNLVSFSIYDQGAGIPATLRASPARQNSTKNLSDSEVVEKAVLEGFSRFGSERRGNGLPFLLAMIKSAEEGNLRILSNCANNTFSSSAESHTSFAEFRPLRPT